MATLLALFRGINVGGNNILRMKDLVSVARNWRSVSKIAEITQKMNR